MKWYGKYGRKASRIVLRKYGRKVSWIVIRFGKYAKKNKLNSEMKWKIWKKSKLISEML